MTPLSEPCLQLKLHIHLNNPRDNGRENWSCKKKKKKKWVCPKKPRRKCLDRGTGCPSARNQVSFVRYKMQQKSPWGDILYPATWISFLLLWDESPRRRSGRKPCSVHLIENAKDTRNVIQLWETTDKKQALTAMEYVSLLIIHYMWNTTHGIVSNTGKKNRQIRKQELK